MRTIIATNWKHGHFPGGRLRRFKIFPLWIGIMPLPNDEWTKGKCGLKGLQYMALGIPALMSPVGVNTEIVQAGINGFLPATEDEWVADLSTLIENSELRNKIGEAGKQTVANKYSVKTWERQYLQYFDQVTVGY
jgi:glycosyltransferase involved in cell wall biosynthesis